jgi:hypothetical protein
MRIPRIAQIYGAIPRGDFVMELFSSDPPQNYNQMAVIRDKRMCLPFPYPLISNLEIYRILASNPNFTRVYESKTIRFCSFDEIIAHLH